MKILIILFTGLLFALSGCVEHYDNDPYDPYDPYPTPTPTPDPYNPYPNPNPYPPDPYNPYPNPYPNPNPYPPDPDYHGGHHHYNNARIEVIDRDVGGGNMFTPKAKISVKVYGRSIQSISLYGISDNGTYTQLTSASCSDGQTVYLNTKYNRSNTRYFELRLNNNRGQVVAQQNVSAN